MLAVNSTACFTSAQNVQKSCRLNQLLFTRMAIEIEAISNSPITALGEGPHWDSERQELFFVDIFGQCVYRFAPATGEFFRVNIGAPTSAVFPIEGDKNRYLLLCDLELKILEWDGTSKEPKSLTTFIKIEGDPRDAWNDAKCDSKGRLWAGTYQHDKTAGKLNRDGQSAFYSVNRKGETTKHFGGVDISNGLAWSADESTLYYVDSFKYNVQAFDFDKDSGSLGNRRIVYNLKAEPDFHEPQIMDGITIDSDGNLWIALVQSNKIIKVDPQIGKRIQEIKMPASKCTSLIFGGKDLDILYVVSANFEGSGFTQDKSELDAGKLFAIRGLGVKGVRGYNYVLDL